MLIDMEAVRTAAKNNAATPCYPANAANAANAANGKHGEISKISNVSKVAGGSNAPPDPMLLALADRYCTAIQASNKARADWRSDVQATPPGDREELAAYLRAELARLAPVAPAMPSTAAPTAPAKPVPKFSIEAPWRAADRTWLTHWQQCPQCQTAGRTNTTRCAHGQDLFTNYQQATDIEAGK